MSLLPKYLIIYDIYWIAGFWLKTPFFFQLISSKHLFQENKANNIQKIAEKVQKTVAFESKGSTTFHIE